MTQSEQAQGIYALANEPTGCPYSETRGHKGTYQVTYRSPQPIQNGRFADGTHYATHRETLSCRCCVYATHSEGGVGRFQT